MTQLENVIADLSAKQAATPHELIALALSYCVKALALLNKLDREEAAKAALPHPANTASSANVGSAPEGQPHPFDMANVVIQPLPTTTLLRK